MDLVSENRLSAYILTSQVILLAMCLESLFAINKAKMKMMPNMRLQRHTEDGGPEACRSAKKMKLIATGLIISVMAIVFAIFVWHCAQGLSTYEVSDVTKSEIFSETAPMILFRTGSLFVIAEGSLNGSATLELISNHGRDKSTEFLSGDFGTQQFGSAEGWVDDLTVTYTPGTVTKGHLKLTLICGKNQR